MNTVASASATSGVSREAPAALLLRGNAAKIAAVDVASERRTKLQQRSTSFVLQRQYAAAGVAECFEHALNASRLEQEKPLSNKAG